VFIHGGDFEAGPSWCQRLLRVCMQRLQAADWVFADLSDPSCHGTLFELGAAVALRKPVHVWMPHDAVWFAAESATRVHAGTRVDAFREACAIRAPEPCPGDSPIEKAFAAAWRTATGAYPEAQVQVGPYRADFRIGKVIVECDGHAYHSSKEQRGRDAERDIYLQRQGYRVARFTGTQITHNAAACVAQVRSLL
jgi:hypothetical protein